MQESTEQPYIMTRSCRELASLVARDIISITKYRRITRQQGVAIGKAMKEIRRAFRQAKQKQASSDLVRREHISGARVVTSKLAPPAVWVSICSEHQQQKQDCPRCNSGYWQTEEC